jgi:hypothetical protein
MMSFPGKNKYNFRIYICWWKKPSTRREPQQIEQIYIRKLYLFLPGNDIIHQLTANSKHKLRIQLTDWAGVTKYANYGVFTVADERHKYRLHD